VVAASLIAFVALLCFAGVVVIAISAPPASEPKAAEVNLAEPSVPVATEPQVAVPAPDLSLPTTAPAVTRAASVAMARMPDVTGLNARVAQDRLERLGFTDIEFGSVDRYDTVVILPENWTVVKQSHKPGSKVRVDELVVLSCTKR
jgi:hypothetical protein